MPGSRFTSTARRPGSRRGGAVSTTRRSHTRRRDGLPASDQSSGVCSGLSRRARSCIDKPRLEGLHGLGRSSRARRGVERLRAGLRRRRGRGYGTRGCGRQVLARTSTCRKVPSARRPVHHRTRHATESACPDTARRGWGPCTPAARLSHEHRQQRVGAAWPWRWGAPALPPRSPCCANQNGTTAKTPDLRRDARSAQSTTARRGDVLSSSSKTARTRTLTSSPGRRGLG
jgi:hypothetical protein